MNEILCEWQVKPQTHRYQTVNVMKGTKDRKKLYTVASSIIA